MEATQLFGLNRFFSGLQSHLSNPVIKAPDDTGTSVHTNQPQSVDGTNTDDNAEILNSTLFNNLRSRLAGYGIDLDSVEQLKDFSPEKIATRVLGVIAKELNHAEDDEQRSELLQQAREGVEAGLSEARDILDSLGVLSGNVADNINRTEELLNTGLAQLVDGQPVDLGIVGNRDEHEVVANSDSAAFLVANESRRQSSLEIETSEGDLINISISSSTSISAIQFQSANADGQLQGSAYNSSASFSASYTVSGDLNDQEKDAISDLLERIDKVTDRFFDGNVQAAFAQASKLEIGSEQLAGFALNLEHSSTTAVAAAYQQTAGSDASAPASLLDLGKFARGVLDILKNVSKDMPFADFETEAKQLLKESAAVKTDDQQATDALNNLVDALAEAEHKETEVA